MIYFWDLVPQFINLMEPQHTPGAYLRLPQTPKWMEFLHQLLVRGLGRYVPGACRKILRIKQLLPFSKKKQPMVIPFLTTHSQDQCPRLGKRPGYSCGNKWWIISSMDGGRRGISLVESRCSVGCYVCCTKCLLELLNHVEPIKKHL